MKREEIIGDCRLILGDCLEVLPTLSGVDAVVTDPPYGVGVADWDGDINREWVSQVNAADDAHAFVFWSVDRLLEFTPLEGFRYERVLVWHKPMSRSNQRGNATWHWEPVFWYRRGKPQLVECVSDVITVNPPLFRSHPENVNHPTQKPLGIVSELIRLSGADTVLDPFMGSGTTGVACAKLGRRFIGIEIHEPYFDIAVRRIEKAYQQADLFIEPPKAKAEQLTLTAPYTAPTGLPQDWGLDAPEVGE